jgi:E3 ubiquitin-protein ligase TRIP12
VCVQLQDVLTLCTGELPAWCRQLTLACPFLFPFDARRQFFHCTALGLSRALQSLQTMQTASGASTADAPRGDGRDLRVGRLQRHKVGQPVD